MRRYSYGVQEFLRRLVNDAGEFAFMVGNQNVSFHGANNDSGGFVPGVAGVVC